MSCPITSRNHVVASTEEYKKISLTGPKKATTGKNSFIPIEFFTLCKPATTTCELSLTISPTSSLINNPPSRKHTVSPAQNEQQDETPRETLVFNTTPADLESLEEDSAREEANPELRNFQALLQSIPHKQ